ncbi:restriction endonuclease subunit S [Priestia megaterium]|uniref:restriction endonuclease subunit S n=1 Tax=Priestia megaterium TaxID=1404 RepID=UPI003D048521
MRDKNSPKIRFPGFSGEWEEMKLGEVVEIKDSARISNTLWLSKGVPYLRSSDLANDEIAGELFISDDTYQSYKDKTGAPQKDDVLFTSGGKIGITYHKIDDNPVYVQGGSILYAKTSTSDKLSGIYLKAFFSSPKMTKYIEGASTGLTIKHFTLKPANAAPIFISSLEEQNKIGEFFKQIDDTIAFHQQELITLKQTRQGFSQKMFPKKGESVPEIRFPGFTGEWENRKLGEVFEQTSNYVNPKKENLELWSLTVENGLTPKTERYNREFLVKKEDQFKAVSVNEFIYNPMNMTLGAVDLNLTGKKVAVSGYYITMKATENYDSKYFDIWLKTPLAIKMYKLYATGSLIERQRVQFQTLSQIKALVPSKNEQAKIGEFFNQLDDTITLHQRELDALKETKMAFLQKMFA